MRYNALLLIFSVLLMAGSNAFAMDSITGTVLSIDKEKNCLTIHSSASPPDKASSENTLQETVIFYTQGNFPDFVATGSRITAWGEYDTRERGRFHAVYFRPDSAGYERNRTDRTGVRSRLRGKSGTSGGLKKGNHYGGK